MTHRYSAGHHGHNDGGRIFEILDFGAGDSNLPDLLRKYGHRTFEVAIENTPHRIVYKDDKSVLIEKG